MCQSARFSIVAVPLAGSTFTASITSPVSMKIRRDDNTAECGRKAAGVGTAALVALLLTSLSGCSDDVVFRPGCPMVAVVRDAGTRIDNAGKAVMTDFSGRCEYSEKGVEITADLTISGEATASAGGAPLTLTYFVALTDPDRRILKRETMQTTLAVGQGKAQSVERVRQFIPLPPNVDGRYYEVLAGFELTQAQLEENIRRNTR